MISTFDALNQLDLHIYDVGGGKKPKPKAVFSDGVEIPIFNSIDGRNLRHPSRKDGFRTHDVLSY
jgi:hypothetical protein